MKTAAALALLLLAALAIPTTSAQELQGVTVTAEPLATPIPYEGTAQVPVTVTVGCLTIVEQQVATTVEVAVTDPPAWLTVTPAPVEVDPTTCISGTGTATGTGSLGLAVAKDAPGVVEHTINLVGTLGSAASGPAEVVFTVAYHVNYTVVSDATFPLTVNGMEASFNVTITQASNARSMVMIEELQTSAGVFSGLGSQQYENEAGKPDSKTFKVTFKAPSGEWSDATAQFTAYGHYLLLDGRAGDFDEGTPVTYSFVAGHQEHEEEDEGNDAPAPAGILLALGLVALAAFVRRRA